MRRGRRPSSAHVADAVRESPARAEPHDATTWIPVSELAVLPSVDELLAAPTSGEVAPPRDAVSQPSPARAAPHDATAWLPLPEVEELPPIHELLEPTADAPAARDIDVAPSPARAEPHDAAAWLPLPEGDSLPEIDDLFEQEERQSRTPRRRRPHLVRNALVFALVAATGGGLFFSWSSITDAGADVELRVGGGRISAETGVSTVASFLKEHKVVLGDHDIVEPSAGTSIENAMTVRVFRAFPVTLDFDGTTRTVHTPFNDPKDFLQHLDLGKKVELRNPPARIEANARIEARTVRLTTLGVDGQTANYESASLTVQELLDQYNVVLGPADFTTPPVAEKLPESGAVFVTRVAGNTETVLESYNVADQEAEDPNLPVGEERVEEAVTGYQNVTYQLTNHDGVEVKRDPISKIPVQGREAKPHVLFHGAKYDPRWDKVAQCETGGNWSFRGKQWSGGLGIFHQTWNGFGGRDFAPLPSGATKLQQIEVAERIRREHGFRAWGCGKTLGYP